MTRDEAVDAGDVGIVGRGEVHDEALLPRVLAGGNANRADAEHGEGRCFEGPHHEPLLDLLG